MREQREYHWLEILLIGTKSGRDGVGARVKVLTGDLVLRDERKGGMSCKSAQGPAISALGAHAKVDLVEVKWPSVAQTGITRVKADKIIGIKGFLSCFAA